MKTIQQRHQ